MTAMTLPRRWVLTVPWDPVRLSPNAIAGRRWRGTAVLKQQAKLAGEYAWACADRPRTSSRVRVDILIRRARPMDPDNAIAGLKHVFDGIFKGRLTPDDGPAWIVLGEVGFECARKWERREEVILTVAELGTPAFEYDKIGGAIGPPERSEDGT